MVLSALLLAAPAGAAQPCVAPPGTAAIEQYCETIPSAGGDRDSVGRPGPEHPISGGTLRQVQAQAGPQAVAVIAGPGASIAAPAKQPSPGHRAPRPTAKRPDVPARSHSNPLSAVASAAGNGAEVGGPLVYGLLALTLLLASAAWLRFRRSNG